MRSKVVRTLVLVLMLSGTSIALGQQQLPKYPGAKGSKAVPPPEGGGFASGSTPKQKAPPEKSKLEKMLAEALQNNPDIRVAAAKLAEAEAELNRTRLQVTQKVVTLYYAIQTQKKTIAHHESRFKELRRGYENGSVGAHVLADNEQALTLAKGKLEELEAQLPALLGKSPKADYYQTIQEAKLLRLEAIRSSIQTRRAMIEEAELERAHKAIESAHKATGPMAERLRKALQTPVKVDYKDMTLDAILKDLSKKVEGLSFRDLVHRSSNIDEMKINLRFDEALPVSAILQALEDETHCLFVVREYGILATTGDNTPQGAMTVKEFLRQKPAEK